MNALKHCLRERYPRTLSVSVEMRFFFIRISLFHSYFSFQSLLLATKAIPSSVFLLTYYVVSFISSTNNLPVKNLELYSPTHRRKLKNKTVFFFTVVLQCLEKLWTFIDRKRQLIRKLRTLFLPAFLKEMYKRIFFQL